MGVRIDQHTSGALGHHGMDPWKSTGSAVLFFRFDQKNSPQFMRAHGAAPTTE
jgi:hypothetical protein